MERQRLQKYLSGCGVCSRRRAEEWILEGRVRINGGVVRELGVKVDPDNDLVEVDGRPVLPARTFVYVMLNKPRGVLSSASDDRGRTCATDLVRGVGRVYPVGRLDYDSQGLLLLTNDGEMANRLTHPRHHIPKTYAVTVTGTVRPSAVDKLRSGVELDDGYVTRPCRVRLVAAGERESRLEMTLFEGKNRQVRRMCEAVGHRVVRLERIAMGPLRLENLPGGQWRHLTKQELRQLREMTL